MLDNKTKGLIRGLIYPIQFEENPIHGVDRVLDQVIKAKALKASPAEYFDAIRVALESPEPVSNLIPQDHPETAIRSYLSEIQRRLEPQLISTPMDSSSKLGSIS